MTVRKAIFSWAHWPDVRTLVPGRVGLILPVLILTFVALATAWGLQIQGSGVRTIADVVKLLEGRSPGERGETMLTKAERERTLGDAVPSVAAIDPRERVLGKVFPPESGYPGQFTAVILPEKPPEQHLEFAGIPPLGPLGRLPSEPISGIPTILGGGEGSGAGSGGGGIGGDGPDPPVIVTPPSAVPEPDTWVMMLIGAFLCSAALRRRKRPLRAERRSSCVLGS
jgi:hypothetical protein